MSRITAAMAFFVFVFGGAVSAESRFDTTVRANITPDDRYTGYPPSLVEWPTAQPNLVLVVSQEFYEPLDLHLCRYKGRVRVTRVRIQDFDEVTWMLTSYRWRWVLRPKGTRVAVDAEGRDLFDFGSESGQACCNPRPISVPIKPVPVEPPPPPAPEPKPEPAPTPIAKPPSPPPAHECPTCVGFDSVDAEGDGVELDSVRPGKDYPRFFIRGRFKGTVSDHRWTINGGEEILGEALEVNPESLEPGSYRIRLTARDEDGHEVSCETTMTVLAVPLPPAVTTLKEPCEGKLVSLRPDCLCWRDGVSKKAKVGRAAACAAGVGLGLGIGSAATGGAEGFKWGLSVLTGIVP